MELIFVALLLGLLPAYIATGKGRNFLVWWIYGAVLLPFAIFHAIAMRPAEKNLVFYGMRYCPHCRKTIKIESTECEYCHGKLEPLPKEKP